MDPELLGPWKIEKQIGSGGMGTVYCARHVETGSRAAVKLLPASLAREEGFVRRFQREIRVLEKLSNPHIVKLLDSGEAGHETYYYAMEYVDGETLIERLHREKRLPWRDVIEISIQICTALKAAHDMGVVHRDLKPSNLLLANDGTVKLSDFGVAHMFAGTRLTMTGGIIGTAEYMSPEQAQGRRVTKASDLYSLGAVMYAMLTGRPPFTGETTVEIARQHQYGTFDLPTRYAPEIPHPVEQVVCQLLEKEPDKRFPDAWVLLRKLQGVRATIDYAARQDQTLETAETDIDGTDAPVSPEHRDRPGSATLMRDLVRMELEQGRTAWLPENLFNNTWVLLALLVLVIGGAFYMARSGSLSPQERFDRGVALMDEDPGTSWVRARESFEPLLDDDKDLWRERVEPYLMRIEAWERGDNLRRMLNRMIVPQSEPERILLRAWYLIQTGEREKGARMLAALIDALDGLEAHESTRQTGQLLQSKLADQSNRAQSVSQFLRELSDHAARLQQAGQHERASRVRLKIDQLYPDDPAARRWLEKRTDSDNVPNPPRDPNAKS